ncbi:hypothetical protein [Hydrogenimonas sp.]
MRFISEYTIAFLIVLVSASILQFFTILFIVVEGYIFKDTLPDLSIVTWENFRLWFVAPVVNAALMGSWALTLFGSYFSVLTLIVTSVIYAAAIKYMTGSLLLFARIEDPIWAVWLAFYAYLVIYMGFLWFGEVQTAEKYRIEDEDE